MSNNDANTEVLALPVGVAGTLSATETDDLLAYFEPDAILLLGDDNRADVAADLRSRDVIVIYPRGEADATGIYTMRDIDVVIVTEPEQLRGIKKAEAEGMVDTETETFVVSDLLDLRIDKERLETTLEGGDAYREALQPDTLEGSYTHLSMQLPATYSREWDDLSVHGMSPAASQGRPPLPCLSLRADGYVTVESLSSQQLGMKAIDNIGPTTADRLRDAGFDSSTAIANADPTDLQEVKGIGEKRAGQISDGATAMTNGEVVRTSDSPVPGEDPVFIDIETDGLNATITWLIGVKDGIDGNYMAFLNPDPSEPGKAVRDFMLWVDANARDRTFITWNGWNFDYPTLREHIIDYCPEYLDVWESLSKRDLYRWTVDLDNAVLPGRTNKLEHVAEGLGWEPDTTGLSGKAVGEAYRKWVQEQTPETELDWDRHREYCRDDVESLEYIYKQTRSEGRLASKGGGTASLEETTAQGTLNEW